MMSKIQELQSEIKIKGAEIQNLILSGNDMRKEIIGYSEAVNAFNKKISVVEEMNTSLTYEIEMHKKNNDVLVQESEELKT
jgi:hypothetical protein